MVRMQQQISYNMKFVKRKGACGWSMRWTPNSFRFPLYASNFHSFKGWLVAIFWRVEHEEAWIIVQLSLMVSWHVKSSGQQAWGQRFYRRNYLFELFVWGEVSTKRDTKWSFSQELYVLINLLFHISPATLQKKVKWVEVEIDLIWMVYTCCKCFTQTQEGQDLCNNKLNKG